MSEHITHPNGAVQKLMESLRTPITSSANFLAPSSKMPPPRPYPALAPAPPIPGAPPPTIFKMYPKPSRSKKRKSEGNNDDGAPAVKKRRAPRTPKSKPQEKVVKRSKTENIPQLPVELWVRIAEFSQPKVITKLLYVNKDINSAISAWSDHVYTNQIIESFSKEMPTKFAGLNMKQYNNLLGSGKGCSADGCKDEKAEKTYWPFARRWCAKCWKEKTIKEIAIRDEIQMSTLDNATLSMILLCLPWGICDSYNKPHDTLLGELPHARMPKLYRIYEKAAVDKLVKSLKNFIPAVYVSDPTLTDEENAAAAGARAELRLQKRDARSDHLATLREENVQHMEKVVKIEQCIRQAKKSTKDAKASIRLRKNTTFTEKAAAELPDIPFDTIKALRCYKDAVRNSVEPRVDVNFDRSWERLKPKIELELIKNDPNSASAISSAFSSRSSTPSVPSPPSTPSNLRFGSNHLSQGPVSTTIHSTSSFLSLVLGGQSYAQAPSQSASPTGMPQNPPMPPLPQIAALPLPLPPILPPPRPRYDVRVPDRFYNANPQAFLAALHNPNRIHIDFKCDCPANTDEHSNMCTALRYGSRT